MYESGAGTYRTCSNHTGRVGPGKNVTVTCTGHVIGQHVQIIRLGGVDVDRMTLCELEMIGQHYSGEYRLTFKTGPSDLGSQRGEVVDELALRVVVFAPLAREVTCPDSSGSIM